MGKYRLEGYVTLPIQMIVECDSEEANPNIIAANILRNVSNLFEESELVLFNGFRFLEIDGNIKDVGAIEFYETCEIPEG